MMKNIALFLLLVMILLSEACEDVFVPDITTELVPLLAPVDSLVTVQQTQTFLWGGIDGATAYNLQIVRPRFDSITQLVVDTNVTTTTFTFTLGAGSYEWSVLAFNEAYNSDCCEIRSFIIPVDSTGNLANQIILPQRPAQGKFLNQSPVRFAWDALPQATGYSLQVASDAGFSNLIKVVETTLHDLEVVIDDDGQYYWRVRAENSLTQTFTAWSTRFFTLDRIAPGMPMAIAPMNGDTIILADQTPDLSWSSDNDILRDSLYLFSDGLQDSLVLKMGTVSRNINLDNSGTDFPEGDYFWKIISVDLAGNQSSASPLRSFYIKEN